MPFTIAKSVPWESVALWGRYIAFARADLERGVAHFDPDFKSFININTPDDYYKLRSGEKEPAGEETTTLRQSS